MQTQQTEGGGVGFADLPAHVHNNLVVSYIACLQVEATRSTVWEGLMGVVQGQ
jgi:hypothetical protein